MKKYILSIIAIILTLSGINNLNANNSEYFFIKEYDKLNNKVIVYSSIRNKSYLLELEYTHKSFENKTLVGNSVLINTGSDFNLDKYDRFILSKELFINLMSIENIPNDITLNDCKDEYGFYKEYCIVIDKIETNKETSIYPYNHTIENNQSKNINEKKVDKVFNIIKNRYSKYTDTQKRKKYNNILKKLKKEQSNNIRKGILLEYLIYLLNRELIDINNKNCDDLSEMLGICKIK